MSRARIAPAAAVALLGHLENTWAGLEGAGSDALVRHQAAALELSVVLASKRWEVLD